MSKREELKDYETAMHDNYLPLLFNDIDKYKVGVKIFNLSDDNIYSSMTDDQAAEWLTYYDTWDAMDDSEREMYIGMLALENL